MILDTHIHIREGEVKRDEMLKNMKKAGIDGGCLFSIHPASFRKDGEGMCAEARLENLFKWVGNEPTLFPFFFIDPLEEDALEQVKMAVDAGVAGFKIICNRHYPCDERPMEVIKAIAETGKPILFHSGILYSNSASSIYNRPVYFEPLLFVKNLRFAMAHVSWPWCDECIAVHGHFRSLRRRGQNNGSEMFLDFTPGTPPVYRKEVITKVMTSLGDVSDNILFGVDATANDYNSEYAAAIIARDNDIFASLCVGEDVKEKYYHRNLMRFLGK